MGRFGGGRKVSAKDAEAFIIQQQRERAREAADRAETTRVGSSIMRELDKIDAASKAFPIRVVSGAGFQGGVGTEASRQIGQIRLDNLAGKNETNSQRYDREESELKKHYTPEQLKQIRNEGPNARDRAIKALQATPDLKHLAKENSIPAKITGTESRSTIEHARVLSEQARHDARVARQDAELARRPDPMVEAADRRLREEAEVSDRERERARQRERDKRDADAEDLRNSEERTGYSSPSRISPKGRVGDAGTVGGGYSIREHTARGDNRKRVPKGNPRGGQYTK